MAIEFSKLKSAKKKSKQRIGRGLGSGRGAKSGRGQKGQKSRSGVSGLKRLGMKKTLLATPKLRGFSSIRPKNSVVNLEDLAKHFKENETVTPKTLKKKGLIGTKIAEVKILGKGELSTALIVQNCSVSKSAAKAILDAGGNVIA